MTVSVLILNETILTSHLSSDRLRFSVGRIVGQMHPTQKSVATPLPDRRLDLGAYGRL